MKNKNLTVIEDAVVFADFKKVIQEQFALMLAASKLLYRTDVSKDEIWDTYLNSYPPGTNEIYIERAEHDCQACRQFLRPFANLVAINTNGDIMTIWDVKTSGEYQVVADKMASLIRSKPIVDVAVITEPKLGTDFNRQLLDDGTIKKWNHFYLEVPKSHITVLNGLTSEAEVMGKLRDMRNVFKRSLDEITPEAIETAIELIEQGSVYRGNEYLGIIRAFQTEQKAYNKLKKKEHKENFAWTALSRLDGPVLKIRNVAIGTFLVDISEGKELEHALSAFEKVMAPANYKRPNAIITKKMVEQAQKEIIALGFEDSLGRRFAEVGDITVNNVIYADRDTKPHMLGDVFDQMAKEAGSKTKKNLDKITEISIDDFIEKVVPTSTSIELLLENGHEKNLVSLIAPTVVGASTMFKWDNNFCWAYNGDVTDSIKESVKTRGGNVEGVLRSSMAWFNDDDLDLHCMEPKGGDHIYFSHMRSRKTQGFLDVDIVSPRNENYKDIVENIAWPDESKLIEGNYEFRVHNFSKRSSEKFGFHMQIAFGNETHEFVYNQPMRSKETVKVAVVNYSKANGFMIKSLIPSTTSSKPIWGLNTNDYHKVSMIMNSPNYWNDKQVGNKHTFFMLQNCINPGTPRGFFNEYLKDDLMKHKRVFEVLGSKMKVAESDTQLSGVGFSSTQRNSVVVRVEGTSKRLLKVKF